MAQKPKFPPEPTTKPGARKGATRVSGPAPRERKGKKEEAPSERPTMPPPQAKREEPKTSGMRPRKPGSAAATVDTVVADLTRDPRREADDD